MRRMGINVLGCAVLWGLCAPSVASATLATGRFEDELYLNPGLLLGGALRDGSLVGGIGVELSMHYFTAKGLGLGGFGQVLSLTSSTNRFCGGVQVTAPTVQGVGVELGVAHETGDSRIAATTSVHIAPFVTYGFVALSLRAGIPFHTNSTSLPGRGLEAGLNLAIKLPLMLKGPSGDKSPSDEKAPRSRKS